MEKPKTLDISVCEELGNGASVGAFATTVNLPEKGKFDPVSIPGTNPIIFPLPNGLILGFVLLSI